VDDVFESIARFFGLQSDDVRAAVLGLFIAVVVAVSKWLNDNKRNPGKLLGLIASAAVWGALSAWGLKAVFPDMQPAVLGVIVGVLAHSGAEATVTFFKQRLLPGTNGSEGK
jgi:hypothetical protein